MSVTRVASVIAVLLPVFLSVPTLSNIPPIAEFDAWRSTASSLIVTFDASSSSDPDGGVASYQWTFGDGTTGSGVNKTHEYSRVGTYSVTLRVADTGRASHTLTRAIDLKTLPIAGSSNTSDAGPLGELPIGSRVGQRAPEFALLDFEDRTVRLSDLLGQTVLLEFWSSWCGACQTSLPYLESLRQRFEDRGLVVVLIVLDPGSPSHARSFLSNNGFTEFITVRETSSPELSTQGSYDADGKPYAVLVDKQGVIRFSGHPSELSERLIEICL